MNKTSLKNILNVNTIIPLVFAEINSLQNRLFFGHLGAQKLMACKFLKYNFRPEFDGILQYFSPPQFYLIQLRVNKPEKETPMETCKVVLVSRVTSYKHKNLLVGSFTSESNAWKICILKPYGTLVI